MNGEGSTIDKQVVSQPLKTKRNMAKGDPLQLGPPSWEITQNTAESMLSTTY